MKKTTTRSRKRQRSNVLQVRVMSPRIAWFGFLKIAGRLLKYTVILSLVGAMGWGGWLGIRRAFHENPDFRLQKIEVNGNNAIDDFGVIQVADIDPRSNLFTLDVPLIAERLSKVPALREVKVERHLPGTLSVQVVARTPHAWVACPEDDVELKREVGGFLVDATGHVFPCTSYQLEAAAKLPAVILPHHSDHTLASGRIIGHPELARCFRLLDAIAGIDRDALESIESVRQANDWSLELVTRAGVTATFGLGDHERQIGNFRAALDHAARKGYSLATINLIPRENVPITVKSSADPPKAVVVPEPTPDDLRRDRRSRDLDTLLNRR
jgi:cell division septal protein FtsQ